MKNSELPKIYSPRETEDKIYQIWEKSGFFNPDNLNLPEDAKTYTIVLPPPNITAKLHLGHSAMLAIEDLLIRFHRMRGYRALWVPGTDHAAIATQNVVEKKIYNETGLTRHDLGKEKFLEKVWEFLKETQSTILYQTRKMGSSLDWSREAFTLDEDRKKAVTRMFVDMYKAGIIYRGERIVNWCPRCQSTLADDEVEHFEQTGKLYTFRYWKDFPISISTTRPETKLGDTAVAVNPRDERYRELIGQEFEGLFCGIKLKIKIIADHEVDMQFGTGALGVTPAHSMVDWKMAEKNNLAIVKYYRNKRERELEVLYIDKNSEDAKRSEKKHAYQYLAKNKEEKLVKGYFMAQSKLDTHSYLLDEGFEVYEIKTNAWIDFLHGDSTFKKKRMNSKYMIFWLAQLST
ncbi:MAG: hypothetical protein EOM23_08715, partial [Candidatus Moranbacteria bacterium]|nr:hypothetical protein [Candidatus Moranbacteria bacterium]